MPICTLMLAIWACARGCAASRDDPITLLVGDDTLHFNARTGQLFWSRSHARP